MWSRKTLHVGFSAQRLVLAETDGMWPGKTSGYDSIYCAEETYPEPWRPAVAALARLFSERGEGKPALRIVLSGRFSRWQLLPWCAAVTRPDEQAAYAALRFRETFGKVAESWQIAHAPQPPGMTVPACAIDTALLQALHSTCADAGAQLVAVTPYFASAFDRWRTALKGSKGKMAWFGLIEPDGLSLGLLREGNWIGLRTQRCDGEGDAWRDMLPGMMAQISIPAGFDEAAVPLYLAGSSEPPAPAEDMPFTWLQPKASAESGKVGARMALGI